MRNTSRTVLPVIAIMLTVIAFGVMIPPTHAPPSVTAVTANVTSSPDVYSKLNEYTTCPIGALAWIDPTNGLTMRGLTSAPPNLNAKLTSASVYAATATRLQHITITQEGVTHRMRAART
jgi:hypothetical protein